FGGHGSEGEDRGLWVVGFGRNNGGGNCCFWHCSDWCAAVFEKKRRKVCWCGGDFRPAVRWPEEFVMVEVRREDGEEDGVAAA
ncbi:hypothetical protein HAX54_004817, partial [Datura stramonium]|nr:hypothetical protein [Datura stramonium]